MTKKRDFKTVCNVKVLPNEECISQHKLLVCDFSLFFQKQKETVLYSPASSVEAERSCGEKYTCVNVRVTRFIARYKFIWVERNLDM